ncbi:MAG: hypothetical protein KKB03_03865 [Nanoarchaeota archaeon]|nr:hypothetical protein [Nanoarchaeota archaeon]MBU2520351.1 hypothetical protein [Nanoarchaeota archaeon]
MNRFQKTLLAGTLVGASIVGSVGAFYTGITGDNDPEYHFNGRVDGKYVKFQEENYGANDTLVVKKNGSKTVYHSRGDADKNRLYAIDITIGEETNTYKLRMNDPNKDSLQDEFHDYLGGILKTKEARSKLMKINVPEKYAKMEPILREEAVKAGIPDYILEKVPVNVVGKEVRDKKALEFPHLEDAAGWYSPNTDEVFIIADSFKPWGECDKEFLKNVIVHEYGHAVEDVYGFDNDDYGEEIKFNERQLKDEIRTDVYVYFQTLLLPKYIGAEYCDFEGKEPGEIDSLIYEKALEKYEDFEKELHNIYDPVYPHIEVFAESIIPDIAPDLKKSIENYNNKHAKFDENLPENFYRKTYEEDGETIFTWEDRSQEAFAEIFRVLYSDTEPQTLEVNMDNIPPEIAKWFEISFEPYILADDEYLNNSVYNTNFQEIGKNFMAYVENESGEPIFSDIQETSGI